LRRIFYDYMMKHFCFLLIISLLLPGCLHRMVEVGIETYEIQRGYTLQLYVPAANIQLISDNPEVATVSQTGLVTALKAGKTQILTRDSKGKQEVLCNIEIFPKRNILFYIATDADADIDGDVDISLGQILQGWTPDKGELIIYADRRGYGAMLLRVNEIQDDDGKYGLDTLTFYGMENSASATILNRVINDFVTLYPADCYGMIFFSHASGWLPAGKLSAPRSVVIDIAGGVKNEMEYTAFAAAFPDRIFDFILFDACLMSDVIMMYELRNAADYVLASSAEIVSPGFAYIFKSKIMSLFDTKQSVETVVSDFGKADYDYITARFPETNDYCSLTLSLLKMNEMEALAAATKTALQGDTVKEDKLKVNLADIQTFDRPHELISSGVKSSRYNDFAHALENIVSAERYAVFKKQLDRTVVWQIATKNFMPNYDGFAVNRHCGLTTYIEQAVYPDINAACESSKWFKATH